MNHFRRFLLFFLVVPFALFGQNQELYLRHYTLSDGLPSSEVHDILEDKEGYIWLSTDHGLARFDGHQFQVYTNNEGLWDNTVFDLREDEQGRIWFACYSGGLGYVEHGKVYPHPANDSLLQLLGDQYIDHFLPLPNGNVRFTVGLSNILIPQVYELSLEGAIHIVPSQGRFLKDQLREVRNVPAYSSVHQYLQRENFFWEEKRNYLEVDDQYTVFGTRQDAYFLDHQNQILDSFPDQILNLVFAKEPSGAVWLAGYGARRYPPGKLGGNEYQEILSNQSVTDIHTDQFGNTWFSTLEDGVFMLPCTNIKTLELGNPLVTRKVTTLGLWRNQLWIGTYNGQLFSWSEAMSLRQYKTNTIASMNDLESLSDTSLLVTNKALWSGNSFVGIPFDQKINSKSLSLNSEGVVAYGGMHGWGTFQLEGTEVIPLHVSYNLSRVFSLEFQGTDSLWIGSDDGLFLSIDSTVQDLSLVFPATKIRITDIQPLSDGSVLVGTKGEGVLWLNPHTGAFRTIEKPLINSNFIKCLAVSPDGDLWIGSNRGVNWFSDFQNLGLESPMSLSSAEGLRSEEILDMEFFEGAVWFATSRGLCLLDDRVQEPALSTPQLHILGVELQDSLRSIGPDLKFSHTQTDLTFHFIGLFYQSPERVNYQFRLLGYDDDWQTTQNRQAAYTNLPPGNYTFEVQTLDPFRANPSTAKAASFTILPHFTQTLWFKVLCWIVLFGSIWGAWSIWYRRQKKKNQLREQVLRSEQKALRAQINPHFVFNAMNSIQLFISENDQHNALTYLSRFSRLIRRILEHSKRSWISLEEEIEGLKAYLELEKLRFGEKFQFQIDVASDLVSFDLLVPSMAIQPFLENAIWHGLMPSANIGILKMNFQREGGYLVCRIRDNGIGRAAAAKIPRKKKHAPMGVKNVEERLELMNDISNTSMYLEIIDHTGEHGEAEGTEVILYFQNPINNNTLNT
ncbi:MAG: histidine kinase [Bacteroidota bacterium]